MNYQDRRHFLAAAALPILSAHFPVSAQEAFVEGKHYTKLANVQPTRDPKRVEVLEFFAYGCSHCNAFEPVLDAWQKKLPPDVLFRRMPVAFREGPMVLHQKLYFALETLNQVDRVHHKVFPCAEAAAGYGGGDWRLRRKERSRSLPLAGNHEFVRGRLTGQADVATR